VNSAFTVAGAGTVLVGVGAAAIAGGLVLYLTAPSRHGVSVAPEGRGVALRGSF
jgi:hypothetical protein